VININHCCFSFKLFLVIVQPLCFSTCRAGSELIAGWDKRPNMDSLKKIIISFKAVTTAKKWTIGFWCHVVQAGEIVEVFKEQGISRIQPVYWVKDPAGLLEKNELTNGVEMLIVGVFEEEGERVHLNLDNDPRQRNNVHYGPPMTMYQPLPDGVEGHRLHPCEKPTSTAEWFFKKYAEEGSTAVICGSGAGGDVRGALMAGLDVVGLDCDGVQVKELSRLLRDDEVRQRLQEMNRILGVEKEMEDAKADEGSAEEGDLPPQCKCCGKRQKGAGPLEECIECGKMVCPPCYKMSEEAEVLQKVPQREESKEISAGGGEGGAAS
jgi:hypothetical protein